MNRSSLEIKMEILEALMPGPLLVTRLMNKTNMPWVSLVNKYLPELLLMGLIGRASPKGAFFVTEKGMEVAIQVRLAVPKIGAVREAFNRPHSETFGR